MNRDSHTVHHRLPIPPSSKELEVLLAEAGKQPGAPDVVDTVTIIDSTGVRRGELQELRWEDVDLERREMTIKTGRNGRDRSIPLADNLIDILRARRDRQPDSVFVLGGSPRATLSLVAHRLRILSGRVLGRPLSLYSLRHAFAARWMSVGGDLPVLMYILGHRSVYTTLKIFMSRDQLARLAAKQLTALEGRSK